MGGFNQQEKSTGALETGCIPEPRKPNLGEAATEKTSLNLGAGT